MSTTGRSAGGVADAGSAAAALREAGFVRAVCRADGDGVAAAGVLVGALDSVGVPFQVSVARTRDAAVSRLESGDAGEAVGVAVGVDVDADVSVTGSPVVRDAAAVARELGAGVDEALVLAGVRSAGGVPSEVDGAVSRRPGVGVPTADLGDGLAHSTLVSAEFSGDASRAGATLAELGLPAELDDAARQRVASVVALDATEGPRPAVASEALERVLRPHVHEACAYATVEGFGDVLDSLARHAPGLGVAAALGRVDRTDALDAWRAHAQAVHRAVARADPSRYSGVVAASAADADPVSVARLLRDFHSHEPRVFVAGDGDAALASTAGDARSLLAAGGADAVGGTDDLAYAATSDVDALEAGVREEA